VRIREIELVGFKSFREPTRLLLAPGINAVVGPNGCGKSNVADAIRWALGEQSVKHLRARDMEDVIFCGNANSAALNFAEVSLTFEQSGDSALELAGEAEGLAAHVARLHEFTITRRIFRSGDSQYFINQSPARLRDITELFLGSGVGPKAYAMIEQGRVGQIVNAKPEEIRLFIEEAAGTTRFRSRKIAAERKLERTNENLARVQDVMREIERQLSTLRRQAKRAEEYRRLEAELQQTETALAGARWRALVAEQDEARAALAEARAEVDAVQADVASAEATRASAAEREQAAARAIEVGFAAVGEVSTAVVRATERQVAARDAAASLESRLARIVDEAGALAAAVQATERALEQAIADRAGWIARERAEVEGLEAADGELAAVTPAFERAQAEHAAAGARLDDARRRAAAAIARRAESATRLAGLRAEHDRIAAHVAEREAERAAAEAKLAEARDARESARIAHDRLEDSRRAATDELRSREEEQRRLGENVAALREVIVHRRGRLDGLRERERALDGYADGLQAAIAHGTAARGLVLDALRIPPDLEPAVAAVLGDALRGAVVGSPEEAVDIAETLHRSGAGRVTLVPAEARRAGGAAPPAVNGRGIASHIGAAAGGENVRSALFEGVVLADDLPSAVAAWRRGDDGTAWVTREGHVIDRNGIVTGGRAPETADLLQRRREVGELTAQIAEDEIRQAAVERRLAEVRDECALLGAELKRLDAEAHAATLALVASDHALETARRDVAAAEARVARVRGEASTCERALVESQAALAGADEAAGEAERAEGTAGFDVRTAEEALEAQRAALEAARARRDARREALSGVREASTRAHAEVARLEHERAMAETRRRSLADESSAIEAQRSETASLLASLEEELRVRRAELAEREADVDRAREAARGAQVELREQDGRLAEARARLDEARQRSQEIEVRLAERSAQVESLVRFTRERHGIDPAAADVPDDFDAEAAAPRIQEIKDRIARLGDVNVAAIADARELEERFAFLEGQRRDLETSIEDLRRTISELSRTTRARFRETFELANEKFQEFFGELFRGGRAGLKLSNPQSLLDSGVEMEVQPPGKSLRTLESLSGGEKALTAISLLMALFSLRATPFCVLDEVDAPLDEANLGRFNAMIHRMSERTQFIVITHHQLTMESANILYGVTMAEAGVSQLVSVELPARDGSPDGDDIVLAASA